jgi:hypothetical protein
MSLFDDQAESGVERAVELVEQTIESLGVSPTQARLSEEGRRWSLRRGSAAIVISIVDPQKGAADGIIRVIAPVVRLPDAARRAALYERLLDANANGLGGPAFGIRGEDVVLVSERSVRDLDASEVDQMVRAIGREADRYDDVLAKEFGTSRSSDS